MAIGFEPGDRGGNLRRQSDTRPPVREPTPPDPAEELWERWRQAYPVIFEVWRTSGDERVCPVCGPYAGLEFEAEFGPMPPLHGHCRCLRVTSRVEWRLR